MLLNFWGRLNSLQKIYASAGKICPIHIPWGTGNLRIVMRPNTIIAYYNLLFRTRTGLAYLIHKTLEYEQKLNRLQRQRSKGSNCPCDVNICR
jgi:hypothetical protein